MIWGKNRWKSLKNVIIIGFAKAYMRVALYMLWHISGFVI